MKNIICGLIIILSFSSCTKGFLDLKPRQNDVVPTTLNDFEAMLDDSYIMNGQSSLFQGEIGIDDYFLKEADWNQLSSPFERNGHIWKPEIFEGEQSRGWNFAYNIILYCNTVLDGIKKIERNTKNARQWDRIRGSALFFRSWQFFQLAQIFCDDYDESSADDKLGIPLKLQSDINEKITRATIAEVYNQIVDDLRIAADLLPETDVELTRPVKGITYALLSRVYLQMKKYNHALETSNIYLDTFNQLQDYNNIDPLNYFSFPILEKDKGTEEQMFFDQIVPISTFGRPFLIDTTLFRSYDQNDLRPQVYFRQDNGYTLFIGSYNGYDVSNPFPATDEIYLIKAECLARQGKEAEALTTLNSLLVKRYRTGTYQTKTVDNTSDVLREIVMERRKELVFRGVRWSDLRRFRTDSRFATTLERKMGNKSYKLTPDQEKLYTWPIPDNVIALSNIEQNPR